MVRNTDSLIVLLVRMAVSPATFGQNTVVGNGQVCTNTDVGKIWTRNQTTGEARTHVLKLQHKIFKVPELRTSLLGCRIMNLAENQSSHTNFSRRI